MSMPRQLDLEQIRSSLIRQEETIIFALIERAQFRRNAATTELDHPAFRSVLRPSTRTFLDHMLLEHERLHATVRRYTAPDEHAFFPSRLPAPALLTEPQPSVLQPNAINVNDQIRALYESTIIPALCAGGDDGNYGSATLCDIAALQAISKRVHYGKFVAESKFRSQTAEYTALIEARDSSGIMALLTNSAVEEKLLRRVRAKASTYGQDIEDPNAAMPAGSAGAHGGVGGGGGGGSGSGGGGGGGGGGAGSQLKVDPEQIVSLYRDFVIPLTKEVELIYLLERLNGCHVAYADARGRRAAEMHFAARAGAPTAPTATVRFAPHLDVDAVLGAVAARKATYGIVPLADSRGALDVPTVHRLSVGALCVCADVLVHDEPLILATRADAGVGASAAPLVATALSAVHGALGALHDGASWLCRAAPSAQLVALAPHADLRALLETAGARTAVLCSQSDATAAGLALVECTVERPKTNTRPSRFLVVSTVEQAMATGADRSLLFFKVVHASGALARVLAVFNSFGVNLENIHPYADPDGGEHACFFAECTGHASEAQLAQTLQELRACTTHLRCLGSFVSGAAPMS